MTTPPAIYQIVGSTPLQQWVITCNGDLIGIVHSQQLAEDFVKAMQTPPRPVLNVAAAGRWSEN